MTNPKSHRHILGPGLILLVLLALAGPRATAGEVPPAGFRNFITRQGDKLMDGDKEFRFFGADMPGMIMPYDFTLYIPERLKLPTPWEQEDAFKTLTQMNLRVVRWWNLPMRGPKEGPEMDWKYIQAPGKFNEQSFLVIDHALALANQYGVRVIFDLTADAGDYLGGIITYTQWRGKKRQDFYTDPQLREDFKTTLRYVLNRRNSVTGVRYKDDKAILAWQFGNELDVAKPTEAWHAEMAAFMKSLDPNHLVMYGHRFIPKAADPNIAIVDPHHLYQGDWRKTCQADRAASRGKWPMIIAEFGPYIAKASDQEPVMKNYRALLDTIVSEGVSGALIWSMYFHKETGGFYWHQIMTYPSVWSFHWPGFPSGDFHREREIMKLLREAAFKIEGKPVPPVPVPGEPEMLPVTQEGVPLLSWKGSAGASGYDIQRATQADGPWTTIAENASDAEVAYRPLYSDTGVKAGETVFYRAIARNKSGKSEPSKAMGPVKVKLLCLVDECRDFSQVNGKSEGLKFNNDYNAIYAEYLNRIVGQTGAWVSWKVPGTVKAFKAVVFFAKEMKDPDFTVSSDGEMFAPLKAERRERKFGSPESGPASKEKRTMVEYEGQVAPGAHYLKINWNGPAELDRVEVYYQ